MVTYTTLGKVFLGGVRPVCERSGLVLLVGYGQVSVSLGEVCNGNVRQCKVRELLCGPHRLCLAV